MQDDEVSRLAKKLAEVISGKSATAELSSLYRRIDTLSSRIDKLEAAPVYQVGGLRTAVLPHPSLERFDIAEAIADEFLAKSGKEKACTFEPNDKPCDHCSMCSSRGF